MLSSRGALTVAQQSSVRIIMTRCVSTSTVKSADQVDSTTILKGSRDVPTTGRMTRYALYNFSKNNYRSIAEVPYLCPKHEVDNARSRMRISINMWIMGIASIMFVAAAMHQKRYQANGGMTWVEQNLDKHKVWHDNAEK